MKVYLVKASLSRHEYDQYIQRVGDEEKRRIERKSHHTDRVASLVSCLLQHTVAATIIRNGKPRGLDDSIQFNTSHDGAWAALVTSNYEVGIDLCTVRTHEPWMADVGDAYFGTSPHDSWTFATQWAMREAELKRRGTGIAFEGPVDTSKVTVFSVDSSTVCAVSCTQESHIDLVHWSITGVCSNLKTL